MQHAGRPAPGGDFGGEFGEGAAGGDVGEGRFVGEGGDDAVDHPNAMWSDISSATKLFKLPGLPKIAATPFTGKSFLMSHSSARFD